MKTEAELLEEIPSKVYLCILLGLIFFFKRKRFKLNMT